MIALLAFPFAHALTLAHDRALVGGETVEFTVTDAVPGETVYLVSGQPGTSCPVPVAPTCVDVQSPRVRYSFVAPAGPVSFSLALPAVFQGGKLQAVAVSGASEALTYSPAATGVLVISGLFADCAVPSEATLSLEYISIEAERVFITAYRSGLVLYTEELVPGAPTPGSIFFRAEATVEETDCAGTTWAFEVQGLEGYDCAVQGPDELILVSSGLLPSPCEAW
jgi:hypothetical protein